MTTQEKTPIRALIEAVEGGSLTVEHALSNGHVLPMCASTWEAFNGSLDAAKALHEALLPGWRFEIRKSNAEVWDSIHVAFSAEVTDHPARAWLLSILKAYEAQQ